MLSPGDVLERARPLGDDRDSIRLVGLQGDTWIATPADAFGEAFEASDHELSRDYAVRDFERPESERDIMLRADREASSEARRAYANSHPEAIRAQRRAAQLAQIGRTEQAPPANSPEAILAAAAEATDVD